MPTEVSENIHSEHLLTKLVCSEEGPPEMHAAIDEC